MILNSLAADDAANGPAMLRPLDQTTGLARLFVSAWGEAPLTQLLLACLQASSN